MATDIPIADLIAAIAGLKDSDWEKAKTARGDDEPKAGPRDAKRKLQETEEKNKVLARSAELLGNYEEAVKSAYKAEKARMELALQDIHNKPEQIKKLMALIEGNEKLSVVMSKASELGSKITKEQIVEQRTRKKTVEGLKEYGDTQQEIMGSIAKSIGITSSAYGQFLGKTVTMISQLGATGEAGEKARLSFQTITKSIFNLQNVAASVFAGVLEMTMKLGLAFDGGRAKLASLTGAGYKFSQSMYDAQRASNLYGVTMDEAVQSTAAMVGETANFTKFSRGTQGELIKTTAMLGKLGVDAGTAAISFDFFNNNLGMTAEEAMNTTKQLAMLGNEIGISSSKIVKDFNAALPTLAVYGKQSVEVFKNLAAQAKAANVETSALLGIAKQFDTFAGAAEGAGKLNALLGTQLSTTQMLMMTEDERIETLINAVQAQGVAWEDMDKYTQLAVAHAAGIQDMNEAGKIFGTQTPDIQRNQEAMAKNAEATEKFEKAVAKTVPIMTKFKLLATELVIAVEPILETLGGWADYWTEKLQSMTKEEKEWWASTVMWVSGAYLAIKALLALKGALTVAAAAAPVFGTGVAGAITGIGAAVAGAFKMIGTALSNPKVALGLGLLLGAGLIAMKVYYGAQASMAEATARKAEAQNELAKSSVELSEATHSVLMNLAQIGDSTFEGAINGMSTLIAKANEFDGMSPRASATLENLALISVGKAKDSMTNQVIQGKQTTIKNNVNNIFKGMKMELRLDDKTTLKAYVAKIAGEVVNQQ